MTSRIESPTYASVLVRFNRSALESLQAQIATSIRGAVLEGALAAGARLPSSRSLALDLAVSRTTTSLAYEQLQAEGFLISRRGSGTFVAHELPGTFPARSSPLLVSDAGRAASLSRRGAEILAVPPPAMRGAGPAVPFRLGAPALDLFPVRRWHELAQRRYRSLSAAQLDYAELAGLRPLREAIAEHVSRARGTRCTWSQVLVTAGAQRALDLLFHALLDPGDCAWLEEPGYPGARSALLAAGARIAPVPVDDEGLCVEAGLALAPHARLAYVTPSHQFPLGAVLSPARREALLRWATTHDAWLIEDDYDCEFRFGAAPVPCLHGMASEARVIYVGTFSKSLFPTLRLGFLIAPADICEKLTVLRLASDIQAPFLEQAVLADFIGEGHYERHLRCMLTAYRERLESLSSAAVRYCAGALRVHPLRTGMHAVADLLDPRTRAEAVFREATTRGIEVMPASAYYAADGPRKNGLILGFGACRPETNAHGMARLSQAIEAARTAD